MRFQFIIALVVAEHILHNTVYLSIFLQDTEFDLLEVIKESKSLWLKCWKLNDRTNRFGTSTNSLHLTFDISESMPRRCGRQTIRANHPTETPKQDWRITLLMYDPFLDHLITELESRLLKSENRFHAQHLLPRAAYKVTDDHVTTIYEAYQADNDLLLEDFRREVARWRTRWAITKRNDFPTTLCTTLDSVNPVLYPSIDTILCVLLTMPVSSKCYCWKVT